jgi:actin-related protein
LLKGSGITGFNGIHRMIVDSITKADLDIRKDLYANIIVAGGTSLIPGYVERLQRQLPEVAPQV